MTKVAKHFLRIGIVFLGITISLGNDFTGSASCQPCHPQQFSSQSKSAHAHALRPILDSSLPELLIGQPIQERSGIRFDYQLAPAGLDVRISQGKRTLTALLQWVFGSGVQAFTPVGIHAGTYFEHRVSFYTSVGHPGRTLGHPGKPSSSLSSALGQPQKPETIQRCFSCHSTGLKPDLDFSSMTPGVHCERCHGAGGEHVRNRQKGKDTSLLSGETTKLKGLSAFESIAVCGECHRMPVVFSPSPEKDDPLSIRFQPIGLMASQCYLKGKEISCVSCHDPHESFAETKRDYSSKCLNCHPSSQNKVKTVICGRSTQQNCIPCHMQKRSDAEFLTFTDHRIRIPE